MLVNESANKRRLALRLRRRHYRMQVTDERFRPADEIGHGGKHRHGVESESQVERLRDQLLRKQAEFENIRKRIQREANQLVEFANRELIEQLLPVLDNFDRAIATPGESLEALLNGIAMVHQQLVDILQKIGLEKIEAMGQPFDPNRHEAVGVENTKDQPDNQILDVLQEGYALKGRLVRPAMVRVARH